MIECILSHLNIEFRLSRCKGVWPVLHILILVMNCVSQTDFAFVHFFDVLIAFKESNQSEPIPYCSMKFYFTLLHNRDALPFNR